MPHVNELPAETLTAILSHLPTPLPPVFKVQRNGSVQYLRNQELKPAEAETMCYSNHGWIPAVWVCQRWRSVILSRKGPFHIPIVLHDERGLAVIESMDPLPIDLYVREEGWSASADMVVGVQSLFDSFVHRIHSLHVWTIHESRGISPASTPEPLLPNFMRELNVPLLEEFHATGRPRIHRRSGCVGPGFRDHHPRAVSFPLQLSKQLRVLDISCCTIANASALQACSPITVKFVGCPGLWDHEHILPDSGIISDLDGAPVERYRIPFMVNALTSLCLSEDSMPSSEALSVLGPVTFPVLEQLQLSGILPEVQSTFDAFRFPPEASVKLICAWRRYSRDIQDVPDVDPSSMPFYNALVTKYLDGGGASSMSVAKLAIEDVDLTLELCSESGHPLLSVRLYYNAQRRRDLYFVDPESFIAGAFAIFSDVHELVVLSSFRHETYRDSRAARRCRWYIPASRNLTNLKRLVVNAQAARHLLQFCEETRRNDFEGRILSGLDEMELKVLDVGKTSGGAVQRDQAEISRLLRAELDARLQPLRVLWADADLRVDKPSRY